MKFSIGLIFGIMIFIVCSLQAGDLNDIISQYKQMPKGQLVNATWGATMNQVRAYQGRKEDTLIAPDTLCFIKGKIPSPWYYIFDNGRLVQTRIFERFRDTDSIPALMAFIVNKFIIDTALGIIGEQSIYAGESPGSLIQHSIWKIDIATVTLTLNQSRPRVLIFDSKCSESVRQKMMPPERAETTPVAAPAPSPPAEPEAPAGPALIFLGWIILGIVASAISSSRGNGGCGIFALGCFTGPFMFLIVKNMKPPRRCPNCRGILKDGVVRCPNCDKDLTTANEPPT